MNGTTESITSRVGASASEQFAQLGECGVGRRGATEATGEVQLESEEDELLRRDRVHQVEREEFAL